MQITKNVSYALEIGLNYLIVCLPFGQLKVISQKMAVNARKESLTQDSERYTVGVSWKEGLKLPESN